MSDNQQERNPRYSWVFHELTKDDGEENDLVSYIAYCLYKQRKVDFFKSKGGSPTQQEVESFNSVYFGVRCECITKTFDTILMD